jgi:hypothetical protein
MRRYLCPASQIFAILLQNRLRALLMDMVHTAVWTV